MLPPAPLTVSQQESLARHQVKLSAALGRGQAIGINGGEIDEHVAHALWFAAQWNDAASPGLESTGALKAPPRVLDLGSGGGVPGLVLAAVWPETQVVLAETRDKRADFLEVATRSMDVSDRVSVVRGDVQRYGHGESRESFDLVTARAFGPPAQVAECGAPLLRIGGVLIVSEPPTADARWPVDGLAEMGLEVALRREDPGFVVAAKKGPTPAKFPRSRKVMTARPLF